MINKIMNESRMRFMKIVKLVINHKNIIISEEFFEMNILNNTIERPINKKEENSKGSAKKEPNLLIGPGLSKVQLNP